VRAAGDGLQRRQFGRFGLFGAQVTQRRRDVPNEGAAHGARRLGQRAGALSGAFDDRGQVLQVRLEPGGAGALDPLAEAVLGELSLLGRGRLQTGPLELSVIGVGLGAGAARFGLSQCLSGGELPGPGQRGDGGGAAGAGLLYESGRVKLELVCVRVEGVRLLSGGPLPLGGADEQKPAPEDSVEAWARS